MSALDALLGAAIDDAGLFPPAELAMDAAVAAHARHAGGPFGWLTGRFVVAASRLEDLTSALAPGSATLETSVVLDVEPLAGLDAVAACERAGGRFAVRSFECRGAALSGDTPDDALATFERALAAAGYGGVPAFVELPASGASEGLAALHRARERGVPFEAKVRCGGPGASYVPAVADLAAFMWEAQRLRVPFKATAGLHHPVRAYRPDAGYTMHGFLNVLGAAVLAHARGMEQGVLEAVIAEERPEAFALDEMRFAWSGIGADVGEIADARAAFVRSFGSCSIDEPVSDLIALGLLAHAVR